MINEYEKQANDFMTKTGATMETKLLGNMPYFDDDKESRDVYQVTLKRGNKVYSFRFGQSIMESQPSINKQRIKFVDYNGTAIAKMLARKKFPYITPTAYDVLACVTDSDPGTFSDFCGEFGYDEDSRKAEKIYFAVQKEWKGVQLIFGDVIEELQEIN